MTESDTPTADSLRKQLRAFGLVLSANKALSLLGLGSRRLEELRAQYETMHRTLDDLTEYPKAFNAAFSEDGWLAHDSLDFSMVRDAVDTFRASGKDAATQRLLDYYSPANVAQKLPLLNGVEELRIRFRFIELALEDYKMQRYHATIPILLMVMDGAVNAAFGKGLHAEGIDMDAWDSLTTADGKINDIKGIFQRSRKKTRIDAIDRPYRNGILHGMDLGYDNQTVAAKSWCFLFVVRDWIAAKESEPERRMAFEQETNAPSFRDILDTMARTKALKRAVAEWSPRQVSNEALSEMNRTLDAPANTPENLVLTFLHLWSGKNYGGMARLFWARLAADWKKYAGEVRQQYGGVSLTAYSLECVTDEAPAISEVLVSLQLASGASRKARFRLLYEGADGMGTARSIPGGTWRLVSAQLID